ncbi:MAG: type IV pilus assembly protein PilM [Deltaproteobacteria bacterium]|nr:type IV pilus assembly protein PilM [Deltaproteobacteria bacterium]MBW2217939.1 type IV pilus assembly protein PilM [Deltaproteobacteria bacterium]
MFFKKKDHLVGLDIGSRSIKVGEIKDTSSGQSLTRFGAIDIAPGIIEEDGIKNPEAAADSISQMFKLYNIKQHNVAISVGGYSVIVKKINVQNMPEEQLQETIHLEAEQYIPFDISDVNLDFQILGGSELNPNQMSVLLVAAKKEMISDYLNVMELAGLNPCTIDVDAFALQNIYEANYEAENECVALIDIGANKTSLNILKNNSSVFMRDVSLGCSQINHRIVSQADCSIEEAEEIKNNENQDRMPQEDLNEIVSSVVADWTTEIRRALDFFYSTYPDDQLKKIVLSGGGANIKEFRKMLGVQTSTEVSMINSFDKFHIDESNIDTTFLNKMAPQAAICLGLALRRVDDK